MTVSIFTAEFIIILVWYQASFWPIHPHTIVICRHRTQPCWLDFHVPWLTDAVPWGSHSVWMTGAPKCPQKDGFMCLIGKPWMNDKIYRLAMKHSNGKWALPIYKWRVQGFPVGRHDLFGRSVEAHFVSMLNHHWRWPSWIILINHHYITISRPNINHEAMIINHEYQPWSITNHHY